MSIHKLLFGALVIFPLAANAYTPDLSTAATCNDTFFNKLYLVMNDIATSPQWNTLPHNEQTKYRIFFETLQTMGGPVTSQQYNQCSASQERDIRQTGSGLCDLIGYPASPSNDDPLQTAGAYELSATTVRQFILHEIENAKVGVPFENLNKKASLICNYACDKPINAATDCTFSFA